jgi:Type II CAAX prenyl endopeptidase Rce1-like
MSRRKSTPTAVAVVIPDRERRIVPVTAHPGDALARDYDIEVPHVGVAHRRLDARVGRHAGHDQQPRAEDLEQLFRGLLLPRMQGVFGRRDWIANGLLFGLYHLHVPWAIPTSLVNGVFFYAYPTRRFESAWMGIIVHSAGSVFILGFILTRVLA